LDQRSDRDSHAKNRKPVPLIYWRRLDVHLRSCATAWRGCTHGQSDLIFDVGLHRGEDTDFYLKKGFRVAAFEADPALVAHCKVRFRDAISGGRLQIVEGAIAPETAGERLAFYKNLQKSVWGTIDASWAERNAKIGARSVKVEVVRVDVVEAFRTIGVPFYLKVDIEGADHLVLDGLHRLKDRPRYISIEAEAVDLTRLVAQLDALRDLGYHCFQPIQQARMPRTEIATTSLGGDPLYYVFGDSASGPFGDDLSGPWLSYDQCLREYRRIFERYRLFGDNAILSRLPGGKEITRLLGWVRGRPMVGWYDTHAKLE
jgi:FkbM family methyltransferase